jgi:hypothetical protein
MQYENDCTRELKLWRLVLKRGLTPRSKELAQLSHTEESQRQQQTSLKSKKLKDIFALFCHPLPN